MNRIIRTIQERKNLTSLVIALKIIHIDQLSYTSRQNEGNTILVKLYRVYQGIVQAQVDLTV